MRKGVFAHNISGPFGLLEWVKSRSFPSETNNAPSWTICPGRCPLSPSVLQECLSYGRGQRSVGRRFPTVLLADRLTAVGINHLL